MTAAIVLAFIFDFDFYAPSLYGTSLQSDVHELKAFSGKGAGLHLDIRDKIETLHQKAQIRPVNQNVCVGMFP